jgi:hypothetical protein
MMRFWNSASVAAHAMLRRMSQKDEATIVQFISTGVHSNKYKEKGN